MIIVDGLKCKKCGYIVYSRARHDMRYCECKAVAIDGGRDYLKVTGNLEDFEQVIVKVMVTIQELYGDWNLKKDQLGLMPPGIKESEVVSLYVHKAE